MNVRHPARYGRARCGVLAMLLLACAGAGSATPAPARLSEATVRTFMAEVAAASQARDVDRIDALMASDCTVVFQSGDPHDAAASSLDKAQYLARLRSGYASLQDVTDYSYATTNLKVRLTADRQQAIVDADVTERLTLNDHHLVTQSHEASVVELREGKPALVKVAGTVSGKSL